MVPDDFDTTVRLAEVPIPVALVHDSFEIGWANRALIDLLGADPAGRSLLDLVATRSIDQVRHALETGETRAVVLHTQTNDTAVVDLSCIDADVAGSSIVFAPKSRIELEILDELARKANDLLGQGVVVGDATRCLHVNPTAAEIFGRSVEEILETDSVFSYFEESERTRITDLVTAKVAAGEPVPEHYETVIVHPDGSHLPVDLSIKMAIRDGTVRTYTIITDATERRAKQEELAYLALHDPLTGLANRYLLLERLEVMLHRMAREPSHGALLFIDLDRFKAVNDEHGHAAGDEVLRVISQRLRRSLRAGDTAARLGGDEFVVLCGHAASVESSEALGERLRLEIGEPVEGDGWVASVGASIGILTFEDASLDAAQLIDRADRAMYQNKTMYQHEATAVTAR